MDNQEQARTHTQGDFSLKGSSVLSSFYYILFSFLIVSFSGFCRFVDLLTFPVEKSLSLFVCHCHFPIFYILLSLFCLHFFKKFFTVVS